VTISRWISIEEERTSLEDELPKRRAGGENEEWEIDESRAV